MSAIKIGKITGATWGTTPETQYDIIVDTLNQNNNAEESTLPDEAGDIVCTVIHGQSTEVSMDFAIKGSNHLGAKALVGSLITDLDDPDLPSPLIVTGNSTTKTKGDWAKGTLTAKYYGDDFALPA